MPFIPENKVAGAEDAAVSLLAPTFTVYAIQRFLIRYMGSSIAHVVASSSVTSS